MKRFSKGERIVMVEGPASREDSPWIGIMGTVDRQEGSVVKFFPDSVPAEFLGTKDYGKYGFNARKERFQRTLEIDDDDIAEAW